MIRFASKLVIQCWKPLLVMTTILTALALFQITRLTFDVQPDAIFSADNKTSRDLQQFHQLFGPDENDLVIMFEGSRLFEIKNHKRLHEFRNKLSTDPQIDHVASVFDLREPGSVFYPLFPNYPDENFDLDQYRRDVINHPLAANQLVADDGQLLMFWVKLKGDELSISKLIPIVESIKTAAEEVAVTTNSKVWLAGHPAIRYEVLFTLQTAMWRNCSIAIIASTIVSFLLFQRLINVALAVIPPLIGVCWVLGLFAWNQIPVGGLTTALPSLVFVVGLTNSIHILLDVNRNLARGITIRASVYRALLKIGPACWLTSVTTMIGFGSLMLSRTNSVQQFGFWSAIGTAIVLIAVLLIQPAMIFLVPGKSISKGMHRSRKWVAAVLTHSTSPFLSRPITTTTCAVLLCGILLIPALSQSPDIIWTETLPTDSHTTQAMRKADREMGGALRISVVVQWPEDQQFITRELVMVVDQVSQALDAQKGIEAPYSAINVLRGLGVGDTTERLRIFRRTQSSIRKRLVNEEKNAMVVHARVPNDGAAALAQRLDELDERFDSIRKQWPGFSLTVTGTSVAAAKNMNSMIADFGRSLAFAAVSIFIVFAIFFRSLTLGLASLIPNAFPLLVTAALLSLFGYPLQITSALTFSLCLGLAVDDTIHVIVRYRAMCSKHRDPETILRNTIQRVGPALIVTTAVLLAGFLSMEFTPMPGIQMFATLSCCSLLCALIGDLLILPATLVLVNRYTKSTVN